MKKSEYSEKTIREMAEIPLHHKFIEAMKSEEYEICAEIRDEFKRRFETHTFCPYAYIVIKRCDAPKYGLLDFADSHYLILTEL